MGAPKTTVYFLVGHADRELWVVSVTYRANHRPNLFAKQK